MSRSVKGGKRGCPGCSQCMPRTGQVTVKKVTKKRKAITEELKD